jgi:hypothetical protein
VFHLREPLEKPCGHRKCCHHDEATMGSMPSYHSLEMGDAILTSSRKITTNLWLKFSKLIWFFYMFLLHWSVKDWTEGGVFILEISYEILRNLAD